MKTLVHCPTCNKKISWDKNSPFRPFCSERCKLIDLGEWASEKHSIPGESVEFPEGMDLFTDEVPADN